MSDDLTAGLNESILDLRGGFIGSGLPVNTNAAAMASFGRAALKAGKSLATEALAKEFSINSTEAANLVNAAMEIGNMVMGSQSTDGDGPSIVVENGKSDALTGLGSRLDYSVSPIEVSLNTGIKPNAFTDEWRVYLGNYYSPLHINFSEISFNSTGTDLLSFWNSILNNQFIMAVQRAISFSAGSSVTTASNMITQFNYLLKAMGVYLFWDGVITYCQQPGNKNDGMEAIRAQLTGNDINNLNNLRWLLSSIPIPPNMRAIVYWYYQTYSFSSMPGSALLLNCPESVSSTGVIQNSIGAQITALSDSSFRETMTLLSKACPNWVTGKFDSGNATALHDPNFTTLFANNPTIGNTSGTTANFYYPVAGNSAVYATNVNDLDGAVLGLYGFYDTVSSKWLPSLTKQNFQVWSTTSCSNKWSWFSTYFTPTMRVPGLSKNRGDVVIQEPFLTSVSSTTVIPAGFQNLSGVNYNSCLQTTVKLLEWMMSLETIGTIVDNRVYGINKLSRMGPNGGNPSGKPRRRQPRKKKS